MSASRRDGVSYMERTFLYENCRHGPLSFIELCLDYKTSCRTVRICFKLHHLCCEKDHLKKLRDTFLRMCGNRNKYGASAPVLRNQFILCQLLFHTLDVCARLVDLVDGNNDLYPGCLRVVNRLHSLRHHAVIRCNHQDCDIRGICSTHTHCGKRLMSRSIKECNLFSVDLHHISADVLGDSTRLTVCHIGVADRIEQGSFTMVNVSHYTDNRRPLLHQAFVFLILFQEFLDYIDNLFFLTENLKFHCDLLGCLKVNLLIYGHDFALKEQLLNDHRRRNLHLISQLFDCQDFRNCDLFDLLFLLLLLLRLRSLCLCYLFLLSALLCRLSFKCLVSVFFLLIIAFFVFRLVSLALLLFYHGGTHIIPAGISAVAAHSRSAGALVAVASSSLVTVWTSRSALSEGTASLASLIPVRTALTVSALAALKRAAPLASLKTRRTVSGRTSVCTASACRTCALSCSLRTRILTVSLRAASLTISVRMCSLCGPLLACPLRTYRAFRPCTALSRRFGSLGSRTALCRSLCSFCRTLLSLYNFLRSLSRAL